MKETVSNKTLVVLLIVAIGVSVMGIWVSVSKQQGTYVTGAATTDQGTATINIQELVSGFFSDDTINSTLTITDDAATRVYADTNGTCLPAGHCNITTDSLVFENNGNANVTVNVSSNFDDATTIFSTIDGSGIGVTATNNEASSCATGLASATNILNTTSQQLCGNLQFVDASDTLAMTVNFNISSAEPSGAASFEVVATIAQV